MTFNNRHPAFIEITFARSPKESNNLEIRVDFASYPSDRSRPISIRECSSEVQRESKIWKQMTGGMLKHKALIQYSRLAFEMSGSAINAMPAPLKN